MNVALQNINSCNKMWAIYINFQKCRQNKKPRSNHFIRIPEVLPDTVMPELECFILAWTQALTVSECPPPSKKGHFDIWVASGKTEMLLEFSLFTLTGLVKSCHFLMLCPSHFMWLIASVISSAITRSKTISVCSSGDAVVPYKRSAWPLHVGSLS